MTDSDHRGVRVQVTDDNGFGEAGAEDVGSCRSEFSVNAPGHRFYSNLDPVFLVDWLKLAKDKMVTMYYADSTSQITLTAQDCSTYVVMPLLTDAVGYQPKAEEPESDEETTESESEFVTEISTPHFENTEECCDNRGNVEEPESDEVESGVFTAADLLAMLA